MDRTKLQLPDGLTAEEIVAEPEPVQQVVRRDLPTLQAALVRLIEETG